MNKSSKTVIEAAGSLSKESEDSSLVLLSSGVKLKATRIPNMIYMEVMSRFEQPRIPRVMNVDLGRDEENPNDPIYIQDMQKWQIEVTKGIVDLMILFGTEHYFTPKDVPGIEDTSWSRKLKLSKVDFDEKDEYARYLMWVKTVAAPNDDDLEKIMTGVGRLSGVLEEDVDNAINQFRN